MAEPGTAALESPSAEELARLDTVEPPKVPVALQPAFDETTATTNRFCAEHLDEEYARLCAKLAAKLARKRPSPPPRGDRRIWAAGIIHAIGRVILLADPARDHTCAPSGWPSCSGSSRPPWPTMAG
jgi:hypothetical protein